MQMKFEGTKTLELTRMNVSKSKAKNESPWDICVIFLIDMYTSRDFHLLHIIDNHK